MGGHGRAIRRKRRRAAGACAWEGGEREGVDGGGVLVHVRNKRNDYVAEAERGMPLYAFAPANELTALVTELRSQRVRSPLKRFAPAKSLSMLVMRDTSHSDMSR